MYMRKLWLKMTDRRFRAALAAVEETGAALGDLESKPASAPVFFRPLKAALAASASGAPSGQASAQARAAAEEFLLRLERVFADLALHGTRPDAAVREAMLRLQRACAEAGSLASTGRRAAAAEQIRGLCAGSRRVLELARGAAAAAPGDFPQNLKFSSIYSGLGDATDAFERCAEALFKV